MGRKNRKSRSTPRTRDAHAITRSHRRFDPEFGDLSVRFDRSLVEDRRQWSPYERSARAYDGTSVRTRAVPMDRRDPVPFGRSSTFSAYDAPTSNVGFDEVKSVNVCERRKSRRQAIFAKKKAGRGGQKSPRWSADSYVHCKRRK